MVFSLSLSSFTSPASLPAGLVRAGMGLKVGFGNGAVAFGCPTNPPTPPPLLLGLFSLFTYLSVLSPPPPRDWHRMNGAQKLPSPGPCQLAAPPLYHPFRPHCVHIHQVTQCGVPLIVSQSNTGTQIVQY